MKSRREHMVDKWNAKRKPRRPRRKRRRYTGAIRERCTTKIATPSGGNLSVMLTRTDAKDSLMVFNHVEPKGVGNGVIVDYEYIHSRNNPTIWNPCAHISQHVSLEGTGRCLVAEKPWVFGSPPNQLTEIATIAIETPYGLFDSLQKTLSLANSGWCLACQPNQYPTGIGALRASLSSVEQTEGTLTLGEILSKYTAEAYQSFVPDLEDGFSMTLFVREIPETVRMIGAKLCRGSFLRDALQDIGRLTSNKGKAMTTGRLRRGKSRLLNRASVKAGSGAWLELNFGWIPLVRDAKTILDRILTLRKTLDDLVEKEGVSRTLYFSKGINPEVLCDTSTESNRKWWTSTGIDVEIIPHGEMPEIHQALVEFTRKREVKSLVFHATCQCSYSLDFGSRMLNQSNSGSLTIEALRSILMSIDRFGLHLNPADIWQMIPFTFVIDWFINIRKALSAFDLTAVKPVLDIEKFSTSLKWEFEEDWSLTNLAISFNSPSSLNQPNTHWPVPQNIRVSLKERGYYRTVGFQKMPANVIPEVEWRCPDDAFKLSLSAAMLAQPKPYRYRRFR